MATPTPSSHVIQIVGRGDNDRVFNTEGMKELINAYCSDSKAVYKIFSIVGAQSSGKSTLMNAIFGTSFQVLDSIKGRKATTKGIWAAICNQYQTLVLDVEGSDGAEHQEDAGFENQSALFAFLVSDVIIVNIGINDIGRLHGGSIPLLHTILKERVNYEQERKKYEQGRVNYEQDKVTVILFTIRDYDEETPVRELREQLISEVQKIYRHFAKEESATLDRSIKLYFEFFHHKKLQTQEFGNDCAQLTCRIASNEFVHPGQIKWPISVVPMMAEKLWKYILENKRLHMSHYWDSISLLHCTEIKSQLLLSLESNKDYVSLKVEGLGYPREFCKRLKKILISILSEYDKEAQCYSTKAAQDVKEEMRAQVLEDAKEAFEQAMNNFITRFLLDTQRRIKPLLQDNLLEDMESMVMENSVRFREETRDLDLYNDVVKQRQQEVHENLKLLTKSIRNKAVLSFVGRYGACFAIFAAHFALQVATGTTIPVNLANAMHRMILSSGSSSNPHQDSQYIRQEFSPCDFSEIHVEEVSDEATAGSAQFEKVFDEQVAEKFEQLGL